MSVEIRPDPGNQRRGSALLERPRWVRILLWSLLVFFFLLFLREVDHLYGGRLGLRFTPTPKKDRFSQ